MLRANFINSRKLVVSMVYDLIIIGAGPAGMSAALYAARYKLNFLIVGEAIGGLMTEAHKICNYPGFPELSGIELASRMQEQLEKLGVKIEAGTVQDVSKKDSLFVVSTAEKSHEARALILSPGLKHRKLNIPGEEEFLGKGVSYCATCDGALYKNKNVGVVGGSDAAVSSTVLLAKYAKRVFLIYRKDTLRAEPIWLEELAKLKNVEVVYKTNVTKIFGKQFVEGVELDSGKNLELDGLFIEAGVIPSTALAKSLEISMNEQDYVVVDQDMRTNVEMVYAAGDITNATQLKQIVTACGHGATAAFSAYKDLIKAKQKQQAK